MRLVNWKVFWLLAPIVFAPASAFAGDGDYAPVFLCPLSLIATIALMLRLRTGWLIKLICVLAWFVVTLLVTVAVQPHLAQISQNAGPSLTWPFVVTLVLYLATVPLVAVGFVKLLHWLCAK